MNDAVKLTGVGLVGAGVGFVVGYKVLEKRLSEAFDERLEAETKDMKEFYETVKKPYSSPQEAVKDLIPPPVSKDPRVNGNKTQYDKIIPVVEKTVVVQNIFKDNGPRVITQEEFMANEPEHEQSTLTYYTTDDQVCGADDDPIDNAELVVGTEFKSKFGWESSDEHSVHIRNETLHMDFEIVKSEGSYTEEVLGQQPDTSVPPHKRVGR